MNNSKIIWSAVIVVAIIAVLALFSPVAQKNSNVGVVTTTSNTNFSGVIGLGGTKVGPTCGDQGTFGSCVGVITNGGTLSTTTPASMTLAPSDLGYGFISIAPSANAAVSVTLPATTTTGMSSFLPNAGDNTNFIIFNATSTANLNITLVAGTGTLLETASSSVTAIAPARISPLRAAEVTCVRKIDTDIVCMMVPFI